MTKSERINSIPPIPFMSQGWIYSSMLPYDACILDAIIFFVMGNNPLIDDHNSVHLETQQAVIVCQIELQKNSLQD